MLPTLEFIVWLGLLHHEGESYSPVEEALRPVVSVGEEECFKVMANLMLSKLKSSPHMAAIFSEGAITQDTGLDEVYLTSSKVPHVWNSFLVLLRNLKVLHDGPPRTGILRLDASIVPAFTSSIITAQRAFLPRMEGLSLADLKSRQEMQQAQGKSAEEYVMRYERTRLKGHSHASLIACISEDNVGAGFDIMSFESARSMVHDRFIEVKSFKGQLRFFWSRNEYEVAKRLGKSYFIYLVAIDRINDSSYDPIIIQNPVSIADPGSPWHMMPDGWLVLEKKGN